MGPETSSRFRLFEVTGIELEYPIVDADLRVRCLVEEAFRRLAGRSTSEIEAPPAGFSNELAAHVFEVKTLRPERSLVAAAAALRGGVARFSELLRREWGARLLPTGMHPFMDPRETRLWRRAGSAIYRAYDRLFDVRGHGWLNVQSCHVNLPFGPEAETVLLHNAICALLPYLPALAASSPLYEGRLGPCVDNRLVFYGRNQWQVPQITGRVVPEPMTSYAQYRRQVLGAIYAALGRSVAARRLRAEWVNSRGAILRFNRRAIEIRILDTQECVRMDVAMAAFVRVALKWMVHRLREGATVLPPHALLVRDYRSVVAGGGSAMVVAPHLSGSGPAQPAREVLGDLLRRGRRYASPDEAVFLPLVRRRIEAGSLSERIRASLRRRTRGGRGRRGAILEIYNELADCLEHDVPWAD